MVNEPLTEPALPVRGLVSLIERDLRANAFEFVARENWFPLFRITL